MGWGVLCWIPQGRDSSIRTGDMFICLLTSASRVTGLWPDLSASSKQGKTKSRWEAACTLLMHSLRRCLPLLSARCTHRVTIRKLIMENAEVSLPSPASLSSTLQFHLPDHVTGAVPVAPSLPLSWAFVTFPLAPSHTPRQPRRASCKACWLQPGPSG